MQVLSLGQEVPLEKEMATHSNILPGKSHGQKSLEGTVHGIARVRHNLASKQQQIAFVLYKKAVCIFTYSLMSS